MPARELVVRSRRTVTTDGERPASVHVDRGVIAAVRAWDDAPGDAVDLGDLALLPGLVDTHVHCNEPGRTAWEGFAAATGAAAAGGVTTLVDMPLNSVPPTTTVAALETKRGAAGRQCFVDVGFWGGVVPGNTGDLAALDAAGVFGFKCFLLPSGVEEFGHVDAAALRDALGVLAPLGALVIAHAEVAGPIRPARGRAYAGYLASRPPAAEEEAVALLVALARESGARVHVVHLSAAGAVDLVRSARSDDVAVSAETCPHYLTLAAEDVPDGATAFKCAPPIRERANSEALWTGLRDGTIALVVSDHSPCPAALKTADFGDAWGGIASVQLGLPVVWTAAAERGHGLSDVAGWMATGPARLAGLDGRKGAISPGHDADLVAFDPDATWTVDAAALRHRHPVTPYAGHVLRGAVRRTWLRGREVRGAPAGRLLKRPDAPQRPSATTTGRG